MIIAELGHNWNGDIKLAKKMIWKAKECGADIAKFQLYDIDTIKKPGDSHYQELKDSQLTREQLKELARECRKADIEFMASAFDIIRVGWLEEVGVKRHKIASRSIFDEELIDDMLMTGKPIIASLGKWDKKTFPRFKADFLYCVARYPALNEDFEDFPQKFAKYSGFSDHSIGTKWAKLAIDRGAKIIEKHFTLDKNMFGCDQAGSAEPQELKEICEYAKLKKNQG